MYSEYVLKFYSILNIIYIIKENNSIFPKLLSNVYKFY